MFPIHLGKEIASFTTGIRIIWLVDQAFIGGIFKSFLANFEHVLELMMN